MKSQPLQAAIYNVTADFLDRHVAEGRGGSMALRSGDRRLTYGDLAALVNRAGGGLRRLGVEPEQRVLIVMADGPEFAAAYLGAMKIGAVAVPTSTALRTPDYLHALGESRPRVVIADAVAWPQLAPAIGAYGRPSIITNGVLAPDSLLWDDWLRESPPDLDAADTTEDDVAFWLWTSGSTGPPKAAVHLHGDWRHCCRGYAAGVLGLRADDVLFSTSKLFHAYGLGNGLMFPLSVGASSVLVPERPRPAETLRTIERERPTVFFSVPTLYAALLQEAQQSAPDLGSVRLAVSAAEALPAVLYSQWLARFGIEILDGIGSTEVLHIYLSARAGRVRPGSSGQPVEGYEVRIVDAAGADVPNGTVGDLLVAGPSTAPFYWRRRALTVDRMRGRWFFSGDKYSVDPDGYYWYAGRADDMFRVSGQWVSPIAVESALMEHEAVLEAAVVAFEEGNALQTPKAFVVLKPGILPRDEFVGELQAFVKSRIAPHQYPRRIAFVPDLPKNATGKVLRYRLRAPEGVVGAGND